MATDPVCGMYVDERTADLTFSRQGRTHYFCSSVCLDQFRDPTRELSRLRRRLAVAWPLSLVVVGLTYGTSFPSAPWFAFALASVVQFYAGYPFYRGTLDAIRARGWNMDVLIAVGTTAAYGYSVAALLLPNSLPASDYFDASSLVVTLVLTGTYLEHLLSDRARGSSRRLGEMLPSQAVLIRGDREVDVPVNEVRVGDRYRLRAGARAPTDGIIREGRSTVVETVLTGESMPVAKRPGDPIVGGTVNGEGLLTVEATRVGPDTFVARISRLLADAESERVPLRRLADRIAAIFVPVVLALALLAAVLWFTLGGASAGIALLVFVSVVITACPCAFGLATPAALVVGAGRAADEGVLFTGPDSLEQASRIDEVLIDKTGTLTEGVPSLSDLVPAEGVSESTLLALAAGLEAASDHPLARAVVGAARTRGIEPARVEHPTVLPGRGISAESGGEVVAVRSGPAAREVGLDLGDLVHAVSALESDGKTWAVVIRGPRVVGLLGFADALRPEVPEAIRALRADGVDVILATGDHVAAARRIAAEAGIAEVHARMLPEDKLRQIAIHQAAGHHVAAVGDGINDAPAMARADLGIAIGTGTDVARETASVVLVRADVRGVAWALRIGRRTVRKVRGNLLWALGYNLVLLPIAMGALVPWFGLDVYRILPIAGAIAMAASSSLVVANSYSLRRVSLA